MSKGKFEQNGKRRRKLFSNRTLALVLACTLLLAGVVSGTLAWLTAKTDKVDNVFSTSDITVELKEHTYDAAADKLTETETTDGVDNYKMVPGWTIPKDPWAKVSSGSEDCYLFVKIEGNNAAISKNEDGSYSLGAYIRYAVAEPWTSLDETNYPNVFYIEISEDSKKDKEYNILGKGEYTDEEGVAYAWGDNSVLTMPEVTKEMMAAVGENKPTLSFTAYAVQLWKSNESGGDNAKFTPEQAWLKVSSANTGN